MRARVLVVAAQSIREKTFTAGVRRLKESGADVSLATFTMPATDLGLEPGALHYLRSAVDGRDATFWRAFFAEDSRAVQVWSHIEGDRWTLQRAVQADVLVALDPNAVFSVWKLAQLNPRAEARFGLAPAADALAARDADEEPRTGAVSVPEPERHDTPMPVRGSVWTKSGRRDRRLERVRARADDLSRQVAADLDAGRSPEGLLRAYSAELRYADAQLALGEVSQAVASYLQATRLAFHRGVHLDSLASPLVADPVGFLAPLRASQVHRRLAGERGRLHPRAGSPASRVLVAHQDNRNFLDEVVHAFEQHPGAQVRVVGTADLGGTGTRSRRAHALLRLVATAERRARKRTDRDLRKLLDCVDLVFLEWCDALAYSFTLVDPGTTKIVLRLHSYEAFSLWPHLVDFTRVDTVVFVSEHLRDFVNAAVPRLRESGVEQVVISNAVDLRRCRSEKPDAARFNLGLIGIGSIAKDPCWALEVIRAVRARDPRYRLNLVGADLAAPLSGAARRYIAEYDRRVAELEASGAVVRHGHTDDVPGVLQEIGVILSTSVRESQHVALLEGAASGAVPVVRDWPFFAGLPHGPRTLFPTDWVVQTPDEAADRILALTADDATWRATGRQASEEAIRRYDVSVNHADFRKLLTT
jgi:glycosyltransferase involved in cell wall biosynthesis